jgi:hypothetical protein
MFIRISKEQSASFFGVEELPEDEVSTSSKK